MLIIHIDALYDYIIRDKEQILRKSIYKKKKNYTDGQCNYQSKIIFI